MQALRALSWLTPTGQVRPVRRVEVGVVDFGDGGAVSPAQHPAVRGVRLLARVSAANTPSPLVDDARPVSVLRSLQVLAAAIFLLGR